MKIMLITGSYPPMKCGVGSYTRRLAMALSQHQDVSEVVVLTDIRAMGAMDENNVKVLPVIRKWRISELLRIAKYIKRSNPDIVHIQYPTQGYNGWTPALLPLLMFFLNKPCVQTWHESSGSAFWNLLLLIKLDRLITVRTDLISKLPRVIRPLIQKKDLVLIPTASLLPTIALTKGEMMQIRRQYVSDNEILLSFYGFVAPLKGLETLLDVVSKMRVKLLILSDLTQENSYHKFLLNKIGDLEIENYIKVVGFLPDEKLALILAASDAVVLPFKEGAENWNTSVDGASSQGVFVLTTSQSCGGYNEGKNIYFAKPENVEEMIVAIKKYAGTRSKIRPSVLEWKKNADQHAYIYKKIVYYGA